MLCPTVGKSGGKWYRGVIEAAEHFMVRWRETEVERSWLRHAAENVKSGDKGKGGGGTHVMHGHSRMTRGGMYW